MKYLLTLLFLLPVAGIMAQLTNPVREVKHTELVQYRQEALEMKHIRFNCNQGSPFFENKPAQLPSPADIRRVDYIYTAHHTAPDFDQEALDLRRLKQLNARIPGIADAQHIDWRVFRQTGCTSTEACQSYFHGFVIWYDKTAEPARPVLSEIPADMQPEVKKELPADKPAKRVDSKGTFSWVDDSIKTMNLDPKDPVTSSLYPDFLGDTLKGLYLGTVGDGPFPLNFFQESELAAALAPFRDKVWFDKPGYADVSFSLDQDGYPTKLIITDSSDARMAEMTRELLKDAKLNPKSFADMPEIALKFNYYNDFTGIAVLKPFERNPQWKNYAVVADLTGSMYPYTGQVLLWHRLSMHQDAALAYFFFNDGDLKKDSKKVIGKTGGIYRAEENDWKSAENAAKQAMAGGGGGDKEENNLEAVLKAQEICTDCKEIVMIADNWATPRDMALLSQIKVPVRVILCGTETGINPEYLRIARETGGSIHTIQSDINNLLELNEGEKITIDGFTYVIRGSEFVRLGQL